MPSLEKFELALLFVIIVSLFVNSFKLIFQISQTGLFTVITLAVSAVLVSFKLLSYHN